MRILILSFLVSMLFGCTQTSQQEISLVPPTILSTETHTNTPTALATETPIGTPTVQITETPADTSTVTPSPLLTPAYAYIPSISVSNATEVVKFDSYYGGVSSLAISPNGEYLAATFYNGTGIIWDISNIEYLGEFDDAPNNVFLARGAVSFNSDSSVLSTGGTLLELPSMKLVQELPGTVAFSPAGKKLALSDWESMSLWHSDGQRWTIEYEDEIQFLDSVTFSPDGNLLGKAFHLGGDERVEIWSVSEHALLYSLPALEHSHPAHFNADAFAFLAFSPDGQLVATGTKDQPYVRIWDLQTGELVSDLDTVVETSGGFYVPDIECVAFGQDSQVIILVGYNTIIFKNISNGEFIQMLENDEYITACAASEDGKLLVTGDSRGEVSIWGVSAPMP